VITLEELKAWLKIEHSDEDNLLNMLIKAAEIYLCNATGKKFESENQLAKLYCLVICADWYENRTLIGQQPSEQVRLTCQSIMAQLQNCYDGNGGDNNGAGQT